MSNFENYENVEKMRVVEKIKSVLIPIRTLVIYIMILIFVS